MNSFQLGVARNNLKVSSTTPGYGRDDNDTGLYAAIGAEYKLTPAVALSLEYERYGKSRDIGPKPDVWTVAAKYSF
jgi:opacity protein-like surface antigen